jgi:hypothetical protein
MSKARILENKDNEVYININDLLIALLTEMSKCEDDVQRNTLKTIVDRLTQIRDNSHKKV